MKLFQNKWENRQMKKLVNNALIALTIIPLLGACGKSESDGGEEGRQNLPQEEEDGTGSSLEGHFKGTFITLNAHVNGTIPGSITMVRDGDKLMTYARLFAGKPKAWHQQAIHLGNRCPTMSDDSNQDGFIDINEALAVVGDIIIPLDTNMNTQAAGKNFYPLGDLSGYYHYERIASFKRLYDDLYEVDKDLTDHVAKLTADQKFGFTGRVFMVQGVDEATALPETVGTLNRRRAFQSLPIVCAVIGKSTDAAVGTPDTGEIPGPVAEVQEGQDQPAPYEDDTTGGATGGTVSGSTGTNESDDGEVGDEDGNREGTTTGGATGGTTGTTEGGTTGRSTGGFIGGFIGGSRGGTTGGSSTGGTSGGTTGGSTTGGTTTGSSEGGTSGRSSGGFIGGFIGGENNGNTAN
jgi:hypothetical protein